MGKTGVVITVRRDSSRLPDKCLQMIGNKETLAILIENVSRQKDAQVIVATRPGDENDPIVEIANRYGVEVYNDENLDPLRRLYAVALKYGLENVVRVTADDILIDAHILVGQIYFHNKSDLDYTTCVKMVQGTSAEIIRTSALARIINDIDPDMFVEHVSYYLKKDKYDFKTRDFYPPREYQYSEYRLTMDYPEDLQVLRIVLGQIRSRQIGTLDILNLLKKPESRAIMDINRLPQVSVYTCCYGQGQYLHDCLESVKNQTYGDWELIIIDDCSPDNTSQVALDWYSNQSYKDQKRIKVLRNPYNKGLPASSNRALHLARGRYVVRIDSDDMMEPEFLEQMKNFLDENHNYGAVFSSLYETDEQGNVVKEVSAMDHTHPGGCMYRNSLAREVLYREDLKHYEGLAYFNKFRVAHDYGRLKTPLWKYRKHGESKSYRQTPERIKAKEEASGHVSRGR